MEVLLSDILFDSLGDRPAIVLAKIEIYGAMGSMLDPERFKVEHIEPTDEDLREMNYIRCQFSSN